MGACNKHFVFTENTILDYRNTETVPFTQWQSKIYPRCSTLISLYDKYKHCYKFNVFIANKITRSSNIFKTKNKSVINFTFQRPSTELVMAFVKWRPSISWKQNYYIFIFFFKDALASSNFTCYEIIYPTKHISYINMFLKYNFPI